MSTDNKLPEGYIIPIHRSLVKPLLWMGVPRNLFILNLMLAIIGGLYVRSFLIVFICIGIHFVCRYLTEQDSQFHLVFWRSLFIKNKYYR